MNEAAAGDRADVQDLFLRYARAVDRSDWTLLRSLYHDDAVIDHGDFQGDADGFVAFVRGRRDGIVHTAHFVVSVLVERLGPDRVAAEAYGAAVQTFAAPSPLVAAGDAGTTYRSTYRYVDLVTRSAGRWAFAETHLVLGDLTVEHHAEVPRRRPGQSQVPGPEDPLYQYLRRWNDTGSR